MRIKETNIRVPHIHKDSFKLKYPNYEKKLSIIGL